MRPSVRRLALLAGAVLAGCLGLTGCSSSTGPGALRARLPALTFEVRLASTRAVVGNSLDAVAVLTNNSKGILHTYGQCPQQWVAVGLVKPGVSFNPAIPDDLCFARTVIDPGKSVSTPIKVATTWDGCGGSGVPACPPFDAAPLLPLGTYHVKVINLGLPKGTTILSTPKVQLLSASTRRPFGPEGGSLLVQSYGCESTQFQPPIVVTVTHDRRVVGGPARLGVTGTLVLPLRPQRYAVLTKVRSPISVRVHEGFQSFVVVVPRCPL